MYSKLPNLVLGFHGCDKSIYNKIIANNGVLSPSENVYDWLGHGIYFWENNPKRAFEYASELKSRGKINEEAVIGAVIDLGYCLNLLESDSIQIVKRGYKILYETYKHSGLPLPQNRPGGSKIDLLLRDLDCAVIQTVHQFNIVTNDKPYDSVRGVFIEGEKLYPESGFHEKTHIQICVINPNCIKGYFRPIEPDKKYLIP